MWQCVEQRRGSLTACIDALAAGLSAAEEGLSQAVTGALQDMVAAMADIAHLDEGRIQRITEAETAALNMQVLENRCEGSNTGSRCVVSCHTGMSFKWARGRSNTAVMRRGFCCR